MNKRPGLRKRLALELFRSIRKNRAKIHELRTLFWECTLRCNASCLHCGSDCHVSSAHPDMPVEDFLKVIDEITPHVDPHKVMITFNRREALVRKDIEACGRELNKTRISLGNRLQRIAAQPHTTGLAIGGRNALHHHQPRRVRRGAQLAQGKPPELRRRSQCHCDAGRREGNRLGRRDLRQSEKLQGPDAVQGFSDRAGSQELAYLHHFSCGPGSRDTGITDQRHTIHLDPQIHPSLPRQGKDTC